MADQEQLQLLIDSCQMRDGCKSWNAWRQENPAVAIDLCNITLIYENLAGANLSRADLSSSLLIHCNLNLVNFSYCQMNKASLAHSSLREGNLNRTVLTSSTLTNVDLTGSALTGTNFVGADLRYSDLFQSNCMGANFAKCDLGCCYLQLSIVHLCNLEEAILTGAFVYETIGQVANARNIKCSHLEFGIHPEENVLKFSSLEEVAELSLFLEQHSAKELYVKRMGREPEKVIEDEVASSKEAIQEEKPSEPEESKPSEPDETSKPDEIPELNASESDEIAELKSPEADEIAELKSPEADEIAELKSPEADETAELKSSETDTSMTNWDEGEDDDVLPEFAYFPDDVEADEIPAPKPKPEPESKPAEDEKEKWTLLEDDEEEEVMEENYLEHLMDEGKPEEKENDDNFGFYDED